VAGQVVIALFGSDEVVISSAAPRVEAEDF